ncbi:MAG: pitrilysin family protein, partial [Myxococcota bacterium]|nr:pitrilysin family protein [Myxococcota bacterium]
MPEIHDHTLDNGLRVVLRPDAALPEVSVAVYYDVGSRNEVVGCTGFAHLFEHMMFEGSENVGKTEHFKLIQEWGGQANATTSQDRTNYYETLPSHQVALGLWLEADRMRSLAVNHENFENQRQTVMEERRQRVDNSPYGQAVIRLGEMSYSCFAYAHPVIGSWEDLEAASLDQVQRFHGTWYNPDNAVLAVAGDLDEAEVMDLVDTFYGDISRGGDRPTPDLTEARRTEAQSETVHDSLARLPAVFCNHQAPDYTDPEFFVYEMIETILLRGTSSRLYRRLVIEEQVAVEISGGYEAHR